MSFILDIKALRTTNNLTQKQLGKLLGVTRTAVSGWEVGAKRPRFSTVEKLAVIFDLQTNQILDNEIEDEKGLSHEEEAQYVLSKQEADHMQKYCLLDGYGRHLVDLIINDRLKQMENSPIQLLPEGREM